MILACFTGLCPICAAIIALFFLVRKKIKGWYYRGTN